MTARGARPLHRLAASRLCFAVAVPLPRCAGEDLISSGSRRSTGEAGEGGLQRTQLPTALTGWML